MVWRRGPAFGAVVDDEVSRKRRRQLEHVSELRRDALRDVSPVRDRNMTIDDRKRIAVDREIRAKWHALLFRRQIPGAQEAGALCDGFPVNRGGGADYTMGNVADKDVEPIDPRRA